MREMDEALATMMLIILKRGDVYYELALALSRRLNSRAALYDGHANTDATQTARFKRGEMRRRQNDISAY